MLIKISGFGLPMNKPLTEVSAVLTLAMFPVLVWMDVRLARAEEQEAYQVFGEEYLKYAKKVPGLLRHFPGRRNLSTKA